MDTVRGDDDIGLGGRAIGERDPGGVAVLLKAAAAMSGMYRSRRQSLGQHVDEIGAMYPEGRVPARGIRHLTRRDRRAIVAEVAGLAADPRSPLLHRRFQSDPLQMAHAVRGEKHT